MASDDHIYPSLTPRIKRSGLSPDKQEPLTRRADRLDVELKRRAIGDSPDAAFDEYTELDKALGDAENGDRSALERLERKARGRDDSGFGR